MAEGQRLCGVLRKLKCLLLTELFIRVKAAECVIIRKQDGAYLNELPTILCPWVVGHPAMAPLHMPKFQHSHFVWQSGFVFMRLLFSRFLQCQKTRGASVGLAGDWWVGGSMLFSLMDYVGPLVDVPLTGCDVYVYVSKASLKDECPSVKPCCFPHSEGIASDPK